MRANAPANGCRSVRQLLWHRSSTVANPGPALQASKHRAARGPGGFGLDADCAQGVVGIYRRLQTDWHPC